MLRSELVQERRLAIGLREVFTLLWWEGAFAMAYETWVGQTYLSALAGVMAIPVTWVGFIVAAPSIGLVGQLLGVWILDRLSSSRSYTLTIAAVARALWILPVALGAYWGLGVKRGELSVFPLLPWFVVLALVSGLSSLLGASSAAAWMSWVGGWVPEGYRGRFFGVRQRYVMLTLILANLIASVCTGLKSGGFQGYFILGGLALSSALVSTLLLWRVPEVPKVSVALKAERFEPKRPLKQVILEPFQDKKFRTVLLLEAGFCGVMQLAGAYFPYFFTHHLGLSVSTVLTWIALAALGCFSLAGFWGRKVDRSPRLSGVAGLTSFFMAISPIPYGLFSVAQLRWIGPLEYFINGAATAGYTVALTTALLRACPAPKRATYFSVYAAATGITGAFGGFAGARLAEFFVPWDPLGHGFRLLFLLAAALRLIGSWLYFRSGI